MKRLHLRSFTRKHKNKIIASVLLGAFAVSLPMITEARRIHDPKVTTKTQTHQALKSTKTSEKAKKPFLERIQDILNSKPVQTSKPMDTTVKVPRTVSAKDHSILGTPLASQQQCVRYLLSNNPRPSISVTPEQLVSFYYEEGMREGIRPDVAFAQALKETGFFRYGGTVTPDQNNYCGLGTTSAQIKGAYFPSSQLGVRAHIQHLLAYTATRKPQKSVVDPRYNIVRHTYGKKTLRKWEDLNGRWAVPGNSYGQSILSMFQEILAK